MKTLYILVGLSLASCTSLVAQMWNGQDSLYGPEWLKPGLTYWRLPIVADGLYRLTYPDLQSWGWTPPAEPGSWRLYLRGQEQPLYSTTAGTFSPADYLEFYGQPNRGELDRFLFDQPDAQQLNPAYSLVTDTAMYYLVWDSSPEAPLRYAATPNDLANPPAAEPHLWRRAEVVYSARYLKEYVRTSGFTVYYSAYGIGEGYGSRDVNNLLDTNSTSVQTVTIPVEAPVTTGPQPRLQLRYAVGAGPHRQQWRAGGQLLYESSFSGWRVEQPELDLPVGLNWGNGLTLENRGANNADEASLAWVRLRYPARSEWPASLTASWRFELDPATGDRYLAISGWNAAWGAPVLYDLTSRLRLEAALVADQVRVVLPAAAGVRTLVLVGTASGWRPAPAATAATFVPLLTDEVDFLLVTDRRLRGPAGGNDPVEDYANYRRSPAGGGYRVAVVEVDDLYEQFAYGVQRHPLAIRNFVHWALRQSPNLQYVFLVGKGREYTSLRSAAQLAAADGDTYFVPSFGFPASDNLLVARPGAQTPTVSVGRLAAVTPGEVALYLDKVRALEAQANSPQTVEGRLWMKNLLHLGGGGSAGEQLTIRNHLESMAGVIGQATFGGQVQAFYKTSTDPIQTSQSEQIFNRINGGVGVISFFGHSSPGVFDFNIDNPENYNNYGKYPLLLSLGCYSGDMFVSDRSIGERFVFLPDKGAIAFAASKGLGYVHALANFARRYYELMGNDYYGRGIGDGLRATLEAFGGYTDLPHRTLVQQFALQGDPAVRLNPAPGPDYTIDPHSVRFDPAVVSVQRDSFAMAFDLVNLGRHQADSVTVQVEQQLPGGERRMLSRWRGAAPAYSRPIQLTLPTQGKESVGLNTVLVTVDPDYALDEAPLPAAKLNNTLTRANGEAGAPLFVVDNTALPVWPPAFALVGTGPITLKASTADVLAPPRTYRWEIDTVPTFARPLATAETLQRGGVLKWTPDLPWQDSTVYYWRISPDSLPGSPGFTWESRSFTYLPGVAAGWGQSHWGQYQQNTFDKIEVTTAARRMNFITTVRDLLIANGLQTNIFQATGYVNGRRWSDFFRWNISQSLQIVVFDTLGKFVTNPNPGLYGSVNTSTQVALACFSFPVETTAQRANIIQFIENIVPDGYLVVLYPAIRTAANTLQVHQWAADSLALNGKNIFNVLEAQGATRIRELEALMKPYGLVFRKNRGLVEEKIAVNQTDVVNLEVAIPSFWSEGQMQSVALGPVRSWEELHWEALPESVNDTIQLSLYGLTPTNELVLLLDSLPPAGTRSLAQVDATAYPRLLLSYFAKDRYETSCPQLKYWRVHYQGYPDLALNPAAGYDEAPDTLRQGQPWRLRMAVENVSDIAVDSVAVQLTLSSAAGDDSAQTLTLPPLAGYASTELVTDITTSSLRGGAQLGINLNPANEPREITRINNQALLGWQVTTDEVQPVLDVTFDGRRILDGDLVSARPWVQLLLQDENPYLRLTDTSLFYLQLQTPSGQLHRIALDGQEARFVAAANQGVNQARIEWEPVFAEDGRYQLLVRSKDASGNPAGRLHYEVGFEVITQRRLSNVLPYPNPFTTAAYFVYTLTGDVPPADFRIQIMTVSGRVVRELDQADLGPLRVGTHRTDFAWDGTDSWGDRLANGVYLYRVVARDAQGEAYTHHGTGADRFFAQELGKIVILR